MALICSKVLEQQEVRFVALICSKVQEQQELRFGGTDLL